MAKLVKELVEYNYISHCDNFDLVNFKQFTVDDVLCIGPENPDVNQLTKMWVDYEICDYELVKTPKGTSCEGQILTGNQLFISANLKIKAEYVTDRAFNSVHFINTSIPICAYVALPEGYVDTLNILPSITVEDVYSELLNPRKLYINIVLMAIADIC